MIVSGKDTFGFFIDYPGKVTFDCGYTDLAIDEPDYQWSGVAWR